MREERTEAEILELNLQGCIGNQQLDVERGRNAKYRNTSESKNQINEIAWFSEETDKLVLGAQST